jgi:DNA-directed RNA polymerase subunit RPC12/RpoP
MEHRHLVWCRQRSTAFCCDRAPLSIVARAIGHFHTTKAGMARGAAMTTTARRGNSVQTIGTTSPHHDLRPEGRRHLRCRVQDVHWQNARYPDPAQRGARRPALPRVDAVRVVRAGGVHLAMASRPKQPVVICPRCRRRMVTKEYRPMGPKARKAIKFTDSLVEVAYVCENCGAEIKRTIRES